MKKTALFLCAALLLAGLMGFAGLPARAEEDRWTNHAEGTAWYTNFVESTSYTVENASRLASVAVLVNEGSADFDGKLLEISADIDLSTYEWVPIGTPEHPFRGTIRATGTKEISGLKVTSASAVSGGDTRYYGLVGVGEGATVSNLSLSGSITITGAAGKTDVAGGAMACAGRHGTASSELSKLTGRVSITGSGAGTLTAGGLLGLSSGCKLSGCVNDGAVTLNGTMDAVAGGLIGRVTGDTSVAGSGGGGAGGQGGASSGPSRNNAALKVTAKTATLGGIVGQVSAGRLSMTTLETEQSANEEEYAKYIWSMGDLTAVPSQSGNVGGFIGAITGTGACDLRQAIFIRSITVGGKYSTCAANVGGILGLQDSESLSTLTDCSLTTGLTVKSGTATLINVTDGQPKIRVNSSGEVYTGGIYGKAKKLQVESPQLGSQPEATEAQVPVIQSAGNAGGVGGMRKAGEVFTQGLIRISILSVESLGENGSLGGVYGTAEGLKDFQLSAENLKVSNSQPNKCVGGVAGTFSGVAEDGSVFVMGSVTVSSTGNTANDCQVGGFAGRNDGTLKNISLGDHTTVRTAGGSGCAAGGFVGHNAGVIDYCYTTAVLDTKTADHGAVSSTLKELSMGGLVGYNAGTVSNSYRDMPVTAASNKYEEAAEFSLGGLIGKSTGTVTKCYAACDVDAAQVIASPVYVGGLIGWMAGGTVEDCYTAVGGSVIANDGLGTVGGMVGRTQFAAAVRNSYSGASVRTGKTLGGFLGSAQGSTGTLSGCVYVKDSAAGVNGGLIGVGQRSADYDELTELNLAGLTAAEALEGWDFTHTWRASRCQDAAYPYPTLARGSSLSTLNYDLRWYTDHLEDREFSLYDEGDLAGLSMLVNGAIDPLCGGGGLTFEGETITVERGFPIQSARWIPIGDGTAVFEGTLEGGGHRIDRLAVSGIGNAGLFGTVGPKATLKDLCLETQGMTGTQNVGVAAAVNQGKISNCDIMLNGVIESTGDVGVAGSVCGVNENEGTFVEVRLTFGKGGLIRATGKTGAAGGIAGRNDGAIGEQRIVSTAPVLATGASGAAGGIVGMNTGTVKDLTGTTEGKIEATGETGAAGGLIGRNSGSVTGAKGTLTGSVSATGTSGAAGGLAGDNTGTVSGCATVLQGAVKTTCANGNAGGLAGINQAVVTGCSATGSVAVDGTCAGGLVGWQTADGTLSQSAVKELAVKGSGSVGGAVGYVQGSLTANAPNLMGITAERVQVTGDNAPFVGGVIGSTYGVLAAELTLKDLTLTADRTDAASASVGGFAGLAENSVLRELTGTTLSLTARSSGAELAVGGAAGRITVNAAENKTYTLTLQDKLGVYQGITRAEITGLSMTATGTGAESAAVGGLAGRVERGSVYDSKASGTVRAGSWAEISAGGLAGTAQNAYLVNNASSCAVTLSDAGAYYAGGLAGRLTNTTARFNEVSAVSAVKVTHGEAPLTGGIFAGGFAGVIGNAAEWSVSENTAAQRVEVSCGNDGGQVDAGGFAGRIAWGETRVFACVSTAGASVTGMGSAFVGGFAGTIGAGAVDSCYASGNTAAANVKNAVCGGFAGKVGENATVSNCYAVDGRVTATGTELARAGAFAGENAGAVSAVYALAGTVKRTQAGRTENPTLKVILPQQETQINRGIHLTGFDFDTQNRKWCYLSGVNAGRPVLTALEGWDSRPDFALLREQGLSSLSVADGDQLGTAARLLSDENFAKLLIDGRTALPAGLTVTLTKDVDLAGKVWNPIAQLRAGDVLEGGNHTVSSLRSDAAQYENYGFVSTNNGVIRNITFAGAAVTAGTPAGIVTGTNHGTLENVTVERSSLTGTGTAGALAGENDGAITGAAVGERVAVAGEKAGGIAGTNGAYGSIKTSVSKASVTGTATAGGVAGENLSGGVIGASDRGQGDVVSTASVSAPSAGGIVGTNAGTLQNCDTLSSEGMIQGENTGRIQGSGLAGEDTCRVGQCSAPTAGSASVTFEERATVELTTATEGAEIYYVLNDPDAAPEDMTRYTQPLELTETTTIRAYAKKQGNVDSPVVRIQCVKSPKWAPSGSTEESVLTSVSCGKKTVTLNAAVQNGTAVITDDGLSRLATQDDAGTVTVNLGKAAGITGATLPESLVRAMAESEPAKGLAVHLPGGTVKLDADALQESAQTGGDLTVKAAAGSDGTSTLDVTAGARSLGTLLKVALPAEKEGLVLLQVQPDGTEKPVKKSLIENGVAYALIPAGATVRTGTDHIIFPDVSERAWYAQDVDFASSHELFQGTNIGFEPSVPMTRAMLAAVLYRLEDATASGTVLFPDVETGKWYTNAAIWAYQTGIVAGTYSGFQPNAPVTREQIAAMLFRYANMKGLDTSLRAELSGFSDGDKTSRWAVEAMQWAVGVGLFKGNTDGTLDPRGNATRAEVAALLRRMVSMLVK